MDLNLLASIEDKMRLLNAKHKAVIFVVTGPNGAGKTAITKQLLTALPFHQTFNLGAVAKTIRYIYQDEGTTRLENFTNKKITNLFTPIVQFACREYQKNGVNVIIDGVQIDTLSPEWSGLIAGGIILDVDKETRINRNHFPDTHFNRKLEISLTDHCEYVDSELFVTINNSGALNETFNAILQSLDNALDKEFAKANADITEILETQR
jgi:hypothetical protein